MGVIKRSGHRHFFYGGMTGITDRLSANLRRRFPATQVVGCLTPPVAPIPALCTPDVAASINEAKPDIVWVGISTPKQEQWMARMRPMLEAPVLIGVGAAFDFHAGAVRQAPAWIQRAGMEWAFRLAQEPRRLWRRYLFDNPRFLAETALQKTRLRRYDIG